MPQLRAFLEDLSLSKALALALVIGLAVPVGVSALLTLSERRTVMLQRLDQDQARIVDVLASGMQTPLWEIRADAGKPLIEALMLDERITAIYVSSPLLPDFLTAQAPERRRGASLAKERAVLYEGEEIGRVRVDMDTGLLETQIASQWAQMLLTDLLQFATGLLIIFALLRYKVLHPLKKLVEQSRALAAGTLDHALNWRRRDELGVLGRSFEETRRSLRALLEKQVEARRKADENRLLLEAVMNAAPAMIHVKDRELRYRLVNRQFLEYLGLERNQVLGKTARELFAPDISRDAENRDHVVLETGRPVPFDEVPFFHGREPQTTWCTKVPLTDAAGQTTDIVTVELDISERRKIEQERQRWLRLFQDAIESIPNGFSVYDAQKRLVICNNAFASLYDACTQELVGCSAEELYARVLPLIDTVDGHPPETQEHAPHISEENWLAQREPAEIHLKDGRWLLVNRHPTAEGGNVFVRTDITRLKRMEQALRDSEQRFRSIAEAHPVPVLISALGDDRLLYISPGMSKLLGSPAEQILADPPQVLFADSQDRDRIKKILLSGGNIDSYECNMLKADGSTFPAAITARRIEYLGADAAVGGVIDLTEMKRAEREIARQREALHQAEKLNALGSLLAGVAHEINNPLSVVVGRTIMLEGETADSALRTRLNKIRIAAERCARIVKTFLAIARQQPPERTPVRVNELIEAALDLVGYGLRTADVEIELQLAQDLPELSADADQLTQVFANLIINAQQALLEVSAPRRLCIVTCCEAGAVRLEFADNGPGVADEIRHRIFEPFYTSKPVGTGTGIGLSFSRGVIESHGGEIILEKTAGRGACFVIRLPIAQPDKISPPAATHYDNGIGSRAILIVDDEPEIARMLGDLLAEDGHCIDLAISGNEALGRLAERDYDLILSDLKMPDLDGRGFYEKLHEAYPHLSNRVVFMTGDTLGLGASEFLKKTGRPLIEKPFAPTEITELVRRLLHTGD